MIDWFIDTFLGVWGRAAVDFYGTYALPINSAVVIYGAALVVWHRRLNPYRAAAVEQARRLIGTSRARPDDRILQQRVAAAFDWEQVAALGQGRLVAGRWRLWPARASAESLPKLLPIAELCRDARA
jgi:hypothetical protein